MRAPSFKPRWSVTLTLLVINVAVFVIQFLFDWKFPAASPLQMPPSDRIFALSLVGLKHGWIWQIFTFQFMHGGVLHLLLNCWALFVFGRVMEEVLGRKSFMILYFSSGVVGGLLQMLGAWALPAYFGGAVVGASAGIFGLMAAFATLYPDQMMTLLLLVFPVNLRARTMLLLAAVTSILGMLFPRTLAPALGNAAHAAHFGGLLMGILYVKQIVNWQWDWLSVFSRRSRRASAQEYVTVPYGKVPGGRSTPKVAPEEVSAEEFVSREVDPILEKISQHGIHSLTERERKILDSARKKMTR